MNKKTRNRINILVVVLIIAMLLQFIIRYFPEVIPSNIPEMLKTQVSNTAFVIMWVAIVLIILLLPFVALWVKIAIVATVAALLWNSFRPKKTKSNEIE